MIHPEELLKDTCPVCRAPINQANFKRTEIPTRSHAVGGAPVSRVIEAILHVQQFACGLVRDRMHADGRWRAWRYDDNDQCDNAQRIALELTAPPLRPAVTEPA